MNIQQNEGFNIVYAKRGGSPKRVFYDKREEVINFFIEQLNNIDFLSINDVVIDSKKLVESNLKLSRYLKLMKAYEL